LKKHNNILFWAGLLISIAGFTIGQTQRIPPILNRVSPAYARATDGANTLFKTGLLLPENKGFSEIALIYVRLIERLNPTVPGRTIERDYRVLKITFSPTLTALSDDEYGRFVGERIKVTTLSGEFGWHKKGLLASLDKLKDRNILAAALSVFLFGQIVSILSWWNKSRHEKADTHIEHEQKPDREEVCSEPEKGIPPVQ
jgi:hypothetical protein